MQRKAFPYVEPADRGEQIKAARWYPGPKERKPQVKPIFSCLRSGLASGAVAGVVSGAPSTAHALVTGADPLAAARAAGNLLRPAGAPPKDLLLAGGVAHTAISLGWGIVIAAAVHRAHRASPLAVGLAAGAAIAALDLGLLAHGPLGRRWPLIRALPVWPQVADHLAFGAAAGACLRSRVQHRP